MDGRLDLGGGAFRNSIKAATSWYHRELQHCCSKIGELNSDAVKTMVCGATEALPQLWFEQKRRRYELKMHQDKINRYKRESCY